MEFSDCHGENVELADDRKSANWTIKYSGGLIFSENDFQQNDVMNIQLNESGHVDVGYCYVDPDFVVDFRKLIQEMVAIKEIRVHKVSTSFELRRTEGDQIIFNIDNKRHEYSLPSNKRVWILIYIKFGNLTVTIDGGRFHSKCGTNISFNPERTAASLINPKPATVCCLSRKIYQGETVGLNVNALQVNNKPPSRFHLKLGYSTLDPGELRDRDPGSFRLEDRLCRRMDRMTDNRGSREWKEVKLFDKSDCEGYLSITFSANGKLIYHRHSVDGKTEGDLNISYEHGGVLLVFELWRTRIELESYSHSPSKCIPPSSIKTSKPPSDQSYLYVLPSQLLPPGPSLDVQSLTDSIQSLDVVDARQSPDPPISTNDHQKVKETFVKSTYDIDREQDSAQTLGETYPKQGHSDFNQVRGMKHDQSEYTLLLKNDLQIACINKEGVKETLGGIDDTPHSHCSKECTQTCLSESVRHHFTYILENLSLLGLCDPLYQGQYLTPSEIEEYSERHVSDPINTRRDFLLKILSKRPICMELLKYACSKSKQKHIFVTLSSKK